MKVLLKKVCGSLLLLTLIACSTPEPELRDDMKIVSSPKCNCSVTVPKTWNDLDLYEKAAIQIAGDNIQFSVFAVPRSGGGALQSLDTHAGLVMGNLENTMKEYDLIKKSRLKIDGMRALQFAIYREDNDGQKTNDILTFIEGKVSFYQILGWSFPEDFEYTKAQMRQVIETFALSSSS